MAETSDDTDIGFEAILQKKTGPGAYEDFVELIDFSPMSMSRDSVQFTHRKSPDRYHEFKPGLKDAGEVSCTYNLIPGKADDATVKASFDSDDVEDWRVLYPDGATLDVTMFATAHAHAVPMEDKMTGAATFKVSGKPVLTPAA